MSGETDEPLAHTTARLSITADPIDVLNTRTQLRQFYQSAPHRRESVISFEESEELAPDPAGSTSTSASSNDSATLLSTLLAPRRPKRRRSSVQSISQLPAVGTQKKEKEKIHKRKLKKLNEQPAVEFLQPSRKNDSKLVSIPQIRDLLLHILVPTNNSELRWIRVIQKEKINRSVVVFVPGLMFSDFQVPKELEDTKQVELAQLPKADELSFFPKSFSHLLKTLSPGSKDQIYPTFHTFTHVALSRKEKEKIEHDLKLKKLVLWDLLLSVEDMERYGYPAYPAQHFPKDHTSAENTAASSQAETTALQEEDEAEKAQLPDSDKPDANAFSEPTPAENHTVPYEDYDYSDEEGEDDGYEFTKAFAHEGSHTFAIDCEFCKADSGKVLTRISIVNFQGEVVLDKFVKPAEPIIDYVTKYSGITAEKLEGVTTTLKDIQDEFLLMISNEDILIGHSLESDLNVLKIKHPRIIDTSIIYEHVRGPPSKPSLKWLADKFLARAIQKGESDDSGHSSVEDALACLDLVKLKLQQGPCFGINISEVSIFEKFNEHAANPIRTAIIEYAANSTAASIPSDSKNKVSRIKCNNDDEIVDAFETRMGVNAEIGDAGDELIILKLRELEFKRKWNHAPLTYLPRNPDDSLTETESIKKLNQRLERIYKALPQNTALVVLSGQGNPQELYRLQKIKKEFQQCERDGVAATTVWDFDAANKLKDAAAEARQCVSFVTIVNKDASEDETQPPSE